MNYQNVILAAGHGGSDSGAESRGFKERDEAIIITDRLAVLLTGDGSNVIVAPHQHDTHQTIPWVNERYGPPGSIAFEIHRDSADISEANGASTRLGIYHSGSVASKTLADKFREQVIAAGAHKTSWSRNHKESRFPGGLGWVNQIRCRSFIIECAFMQGKNDDAHLTWLAETVAKGLVGLV